MNVCRIYKATWDYLRAWARWTHSQEWRNKSVSWRDTMVSLKFDNPNWMSPLLIRKELISPRKTPVTIGSIVWRIFEWDQNWLESPYRLVLPNRPTRFEERGNPIVVYMDEIQRMIDSAMKKGLVIPKFIHLYPPAIEKFEYPRGFKIPNFSLLSGKLSPSLQDHIARFTLVWIW